ncbi:MAG: Ig-like domain-containing protein [Bacteroidales bacterium]|jgi:hypothetical protein|nr:Ig-like domain-containing protein [Bacteroidales bacterium]
MKTKTIPLIGLLVFGMSFCGCKDKTVEMTGISVSPTSVLLVYGGTPDSQQITAEAVPENATGVNFSWASGDNAIAAVSRSGLITATGIGSTQISVMAGNRIKKIPVTVVSPEDAPGGYTSSGADTWVATDALGREIGTQEAYGMPKPGVVGIFYFIWLGAHGYDTHEDHQEVQQPKASDTNSPYDISKLLAANPSNPQYGPVHAFHHWGEPHFGYYVSNDEWVIEKHMQLFADAGIDVIFFDNTNALPYLPTILTVCRVMERMRAQGRTTPKIASLLHSNPANTLQQLYDGLYAQGLYRDLWFEWKGKPLVLCPDENLPAECRSFFTLRDSWFDSRGAWFGNGRDKWPWADYYPQGFGWHESAGKAEHISVAAATHPTSNIGRSYSNGQQPATFRSGEGLFFGEQWRRALEVKPEFLFITGWNEWVAMRFTDGAAGQMCGKPIAKGDSYFVDQYNEEYSRDIEPMRGGFGDNYYYRLVDNIRRYKGVQAIPAASGQHTIAIDGDEADWSAVTPVFADDRGDVTARNHFGWGRIGQLVNNDGRNDFVSGKAATDNSNAYFCMKTASDVALTGAPLQLFIRTGQGEPAWEGFRYRVDVMVDKGELYVSKGGWNWEKTADIPCRVSRNFIELSVSLQQLNVTAGAKTIDFKWADNMPQAGDIRDFMDHGDTAPNARFRYRYILNPN